MSSETYRFKDHFKFVFDNLVVSKKKKNAFIGEELPDFALN